MLAANPTMTEQTLTSSFDELEDEETSQLYEHYRIVADKGQKLLRVD
jgi:hypothetical protein